MLVYKGAIFVLNLVHAYSVNKIIFSLTTIVGKFVNKDFMLTDKRYLAMLVLLYVRAVYHQILVCFVNLKNICCTVCVIQNVLMDTTIISVLYAKNVINV